MGFWTPQNTKSLVLKVQKWAENGKKQQHNKKFTRIKINKMEINNNVLKLIIVTVDIRHFQVTQMHQSFLGGSSLLCFMITTIRIR